MLLLVKVMPITNIIMAVPRPNRGDTVFKMNQRKVIKIPSGITACFDMNAPTPDRRTLLDFFRGLYANGGQLTDYDPRDGDVYSGRVVQIEHEVYGDPDPEGQTGPEGYVFVQRYYAYSTANCLGLLEMNNIQGKYVRAITGPWPNP
jgi:hypothetical protein